jgi:hypothetical protein
LKVYFDGLKFSGNNRFIYIASDANKNPVYYCDPNVPLDRNALRCLKGTPCIDGIIASCCATKCIDYGPSAEDFSIQLFQQKNEILLPTNTEQRVYGGAQCFMVDDQFLLDGFTPTPLVIDYLKQLPGNHVVVDFGNGGPTYEIWRKSIGAKDNVAIIKTDINVIKVFFH